MIKITKAAAAIICLTRLGICSGFSQISVSGDLQLFISGQIDGLPSSGSAVYNDPTEDQQTIWAEALNLFYSGNYSSAHEKLSSVDYRLIDFEDTESDNSFYVISRVSGGVNYWGTYVYNQSACRDLVLQAPHPKYDTNTGDQAFFTFLELNARTYFLSGTHRCNSSLTSECSGTTTACGSSAPFKISDPAHNDVSMFQLTTDLHHEHYTEDVFIQFHGFGKQSTDPNAILSNGTRETPETDYIDLLIVEMLKDDASLEFKAAHLDQSWDRLIAFTNTQGRLLNQSSDPCSQSASLSSGQFIHIEQEKDLFRATKAGWQKWIAPMSRVFDCKQAILKSEILDESIIYPVPFNDHLSFQVKSNASRLLVYSMAGEMIVEKYPTDWGAIDLSELEVGTYVYQIQDKQSNTIYRGKVVKK